MSDVFRTYIFPAFLTLGALMLLAVETRTLQHDLARKSTRWPRFVRRILGALVIEAIAFMVHFSPRLPRPGTSTAKVWQQYDYWMWVLGLVLVAVALAFWDVIASIRALKQQIDAIYREEDMPLLEEQLRGRR